MKAIEKLEQAKSLMLSALSDAGVDKEIDMHTYIKIDRKLDVAYDLITEIVKIINEVPRQNEIDILSDRAVLNREYESSVL